MNDLMVLLNLLVALMLLVILIAYACFRFAFYVRKKPKAAGDPIILPQGEIYEPYYEDMTRWVKQIREMPHEDVRILSRDGLRLTGKYYEFAPGAPIELMFHGYRGSAERDLSGGVQRCFRLGRSALVVEQRCSNTSQGNVITFGLREHLDCLDWIDFTIRHYGADVKIILTGISMGASTVLMAAGKELPENVIGVLADCGFTSAKDIMYHVMGQMKLPAKLCYPFVKLGAKLFGHFDLDTYSARDAMRTCKAPVIFFHGETDVFVPCSMSRENFEACVSRKRIVTMPGAGHGLSYPAEPDRYVQALLEFFGPEASHPSIFGK